MAIFGLFKKKEKPVTETPVTETPAAEQPAQSTGSEFNHTLVEKYGPFTGGEVELNAVTGPIPFGVAPSEMEANPNGPWPALLGLTAWYEDDGETQEGQALLVAAADNRLLSHLREMAPRNGMIQVKARKSERKNVYLMTALPTPVMDPELKTILLKQLEPVTINPDGLGEFTLDRTSNLFQGELDWVNGESILLSFPKCREEQLEQIFAAARFLSANADSWNTRVMEQAVRHTEEEISISALDLSNDGEMSFWLGNDEDPEFLCLRATPEGGFLPVED